MAGSLNTPGYDLQPSSVKATLPTNYLGSGDFNFLNQYLPDTYEAEFERYGNRSIASFLRNVSAEIPSASDLIKWAEQGRLHTKYVDVTTTDTAGSSTATWTVNDTDSSGNYLNCNFRAGQTVFLSSNGANLSDKAYITNVTPASGSVTPSEFEVAYYAVGGQNIAASTAATSFVYGSEFRKGSTGMEGSLDPVDDIFEVKPVIIKDKFEVSGSDMAQIGWVEVTTENGATGYLWYVKAEHETRLRFEDYLEMMMIEHVPTDSGSGVANQVNGLGGNSGSQGLFDAIETRGNVWSGGNPSTLGEFDDIVSRLDKQGAIAENVLFVNREFSFDIDDMLAAQNSYGVGGTSYGLFDNDKDMALNLGFTSFRRGYDFYKSDWKYLNDAALRGGIVGGAVNGVLIPAGTMSVYDQVMGKNMKRPFLHVRYRANEAENRKMKTWVTGSAGGAATSDLDAMQVNFLSERALCTLGANNFVLFKD
jgi:hypothetical protein